MARFCSQGARAGVWRSTMRRRHGGPFGISHWSVSTMNVRTMAEEGGVPSARDRSDPSHRWVAAKQALEAQPPPLSATWMTSLRPHTQAGRSTGKPVAAGNRSDRLESPRVRRTEKASAFQRLKAAP